MNKLPKFTPICLAPPHQLLQSGVKRFFAHLTAVLTTVLLGILVTACDPIISSGSGTTQQTPSGVSTSPISEGDFLDSPGPIAGPAIIEFWNGQGGANKVCGTFQLPSGESFSYRPAGHWWKYKSDQDMQVEWPLHLKLYNQKSENAPCTRGERPPS